MPKYTVSGDEWAEEFMAIVLTGSTSYQHVFSFSGKDRDELIQEIALEAATNLEAFLQENLVASTEHEE